MVGSAFFCLHLPLSNSKPAVHVVHDVKLEHDVHPLGQSKQRPPPRERNASAARAQTLLALKENKHFLTEVGAFLRESPYCVKMQCFAAP